ncbi:unnamed protein product, partial [Dibothriocephalus latus]
MQQPFSNDAVGQQQDTKNRILVQKKLILLSHAMQCRKNRQAGLLVNCSSPACAEVQEILSHISTCDRHRACPRPHCVSSKLVINHWSTCTNPNCPVCSPLRDSSQHARTQADISGQNISGGRNTNNFPYEGNSASQAFSRSSNALSDTIPLSHLSNCPNGTSWRNEVNTATRERYLKKFYKELFLPNLTMPPDRRAILIMDRVKAYEKELYTNSTSKEEYSEKLSRCCLNIQNELKNAYRNIPSGLSNGTSSPLPCKVEPPTSNDMNFAQGGSGIVPSDCTHRNTFHSAEHFQSNELVQSNNTLMKLEPASESPQTTVPTCENSSTSQNSIFDSTAVEVKQEAVLTQATSEKPQVLVNGEVKGLKQDGSVSEFVSGFLPSSSPSAVSQNADLKESKCVSWSRKELLNTFSPLLQELKLESSALPFLQPVQYKELGLVDYLSVVSTPMDLSLIEEKLNNGAYKDPWGVVDDFWLMFNNAWLYNKKASKVYKHCSQLAEKFESLVDPAMQSLGFCCGREYVFYPHVLACLTEKSCNINRDAVYYAFDNSDKKQPGLIWDKYIVCEKCFLEADEKVAIDDTNSAVFIEKSLFEKQKNNIIVKEDFVNCRECNRKWHKICACYMEEIWPTGFLCPKCIKDGSLTRPLNRYTAKRIPTCKLSNYLEKRVNDFMKRKGCNTSSVIVRVLASADKTMEVKKYMKKHFVEKANFPESFPYRVKAIFAFQEIDGQEVCFFGLHVQEYSSECPAPNNRRVYIAYLDSVHFFQPKQYRTDIYHEILIGYMDYAKQLGFATAHIWACPPGEGDDYIFHMHPAEQKIPKPRRLQEWYQKMLKKAHNERIVADYNDICQDAGDVDSFSPANLPYFDGDYWPNTLEDIFKSVEEEENKRKREEAELAKGDDIEDVVDEDSNHGDSDRKPGKKKAKKRKMKRTTSAMALGKRKRFNGLGISDPGSEVARKVYEIMEKNKETFFVIRLHQPSAVASLGPIKDPDPLIASELMECRDNFLGRAREKHLEFSSLRRAKYSTLAFMYDIHTENRSSLMYTCNKCSNQISMPWQCVQCDDYHLCDSCYQQKKHPHPMTQVNVSDGNLNEDSSGAAVQESSRNLVERFVELLEHTYSCRDANCYIKACQGMKKKLEHFKLHHDWTKCPICKHVYTFLIAHSNKCHETKCPVVLCDKFKAKKKQQESQRRMMQVQHLRRRQATMQRSNSKTPQQQPNTPQPPSVSVCHLPLSQTNVQQASPSVSQCTPTSSEPPLSFSTQNSLTSPNSVHSRNSPIKSTNTPLHQPVGAPIVSNRSLQYSHSSPYQLSGLQNPQQQTTPSPGNSHKTCHVQPSSVPPQQVQQQQIYNHQQQQQQQQQVFIAASPNVGDYQQMPASNASAASQPPIYNDSTQPMIQMSNSSYAPQPVLQQYFPRSNLHSPHGMKNFASADQLMAANSRDQAQFVRQSSQQRPEDLFPPNPGVLRLQSSSGYE